MQRPINIGSLLASVWMGLYLVAFTIQYGALFDFYIDDITRYSRVFEAIVILSYVALSAIRLTPTCLLAVAVFALLVFYHLIFVQYSGLEANFNALFGYMPCLAFVPLAESRLPWRRICDLLFWITFAYIAIYIGSYNSLVKAALYAATTEDVPGGVLNSGDYRGSRVFLAALSVTYVIFYALHNRQLFLPVRVLAAVLAAAALAMSGSRLIGILLVVALAFDLSRIHRRSVSIALVAIFLVISGIHLFGVADPTWNPYSSFSDDPSGMGRQTEYAPAVEAVLRYGVTGIGIEPDGTAAAKLLRVPPGHMPVYFGDLAALGVLGQFGIIGLAIFLSLSVAGILSVNAPEEGAASAVRWNCLLNALYGIIAPSVLFPPACFFTCMLFADYLRRRKAYAERAPRTVSRFLPIAPSRKPERGSRRFL